MKIEPLYKVKDTVRYMFFNRYRGYIIVKGEITRVVKRKLGFFKKREVFDYNILFNSFGRDYWETVNECSIIDKVEDNKKIT